jgi:fatty acid desaturase
VTDPHPTPPNGDKREDTPAELVDRLFRVAKTFLIPFLGSWLFAYAGGTLGFEWVYYAGLAGVGVSIIGLLLWLLHH